MPLFRIPKSLKLPLWEFYEDAACIVIGVIVVWWATICRRGQGIVWASVTTFIA